MPTAYRFDGGIYCHFSDLEVEKVPKSLSDRKYVRISLSRKIKKFDFHPGNLSMAVNTYEKPPKKN